MAIGSSNQPNFNLQGTTNNQSLVYDSSQNAFVNANISQTGNVTDGANLGTGQKIFKSANIAGPFSRIYFILFF